MPDGFAPLPGMAATTCGGVSGPERGSPQDGGRRGFVCRGRAAGGQLWVGGGGGLAMARVGEEPFCGAAGWASPYPDMAAAPLAGPKGDCRQICGTGGGTRLPWGASGAFTGERVCTSAALPAIGTLPSALASRVPPAASRRSSRIPKGWEPPFPSVSSPPSACASHPAPRCLFSFFFFFTV